MKISNETKVGILSITALVLLIVGFNFLKGKDIFNRSKKIYMVFHDLGSLTKSNEVKINGYVIGKVYDLNAMDKDVTSVSSAVLVVVLGATGGSWANKVNGPHENAAISKQ